MYVIVDVFDRMDGIAVDSFNGGENEVLDAMYAYGFSSYVVDKVDDAITDLYGELPHARSKSVTVAAYEFTITKV